MTEFAEGDLKLAEELALAGVPRCDFMLALIAEVRRLKAEVGKLLQHRCRETSPYANDAGTEREACARLAEEDCSEPPMCGAGEYGCHRRIAAAIRARK